MLKKTIKKKVKKNSSLNLFLNRNFKIVRLALFVLIIILLLLFLVQPKYVSINQEKQTLLEEKVNELEGLEQYMQGLEKLKIIMAEFQKKYAKNIEDLSQLLPNEAEVPNLIAQLEAVVQSSGFSIGSLAITEGSVEVNKKSSKGNEESSEESLDLPELDSSIHVIKIGINVSGGDYFNFKLLLDNLEKHLRIIDVTSMGFSGGSEGSPIILMLNTYYFVQ